MTEPPTKTRNPTARAVFAAHKTRIGEMLTNDRLMKEIFDELEFPGSYTQFTRYCAKAFKPTPETPPLDPPPPSRPAPGPVPAATPAPVLVADEREPGPGPIRPGKVETPTWNPAKLKRTEVLKPRTDDK